jgi:hypothetical protein
MKYFTVIAGLAFMIGCHRDGAHGGSIGDTPAGITEFHDDFSDGFPGDNWVVEDGEPAVAMDEGNSAPALILDPALGDVRVRSSFTFSTSDPMEISLQVGALQSPPEAVLFKFLVRRGEAVESETSAEVSPLDGEIRLMIFGEQIFMPLITTGGLTTIAFSVDASGVATWFVDGVPAMTRGGFPESFYRIELEAHGSGADVFVVDNVKLTRPSEAQRTGGPS